MNLKEFLEHNCKIKNYIILVDEQIFRIYILLKEKLKDEKVKLDLIKNYLILNNKFYDLYFVNSDNNIYIRSRTDNKSKKGKR